MKRYRLIQTACLAALAVGFASCSQDELLTSSEGAGTAVTFTATGIAMPQVETRATVDGTWEDGMSVAVKIGSVVKEYDVTPNADDPKRATLAAADGVTPFVWASITEKKSVSAWYPYTAGQTAMPALVVQQDQSIEANYLASDLLSVSKQVTYGDNNLQFAHRTAKITLELKANEGNTLSMENAQVILHNLSTANGNPGLITCFDASAGDTYIHNALIAPQTFAAGKELLKIVLSDGTVFGYVPDKAVNFQAGYQYPLIIRLTDTGIRVTVGEAIPWGDEVSSENSMVISKDGYYITSDATGRLTYYVSTEAGLKAWAEYTNQGNWDTNLTLMNNITMTKPEDGSPNWTPIGRLESSTAYYSNYIGTIDGNGHTIDNIVMNDSSNAGLICSLGGDGYIKNLSIGSGSYFKSSYMAGSLAASSSGKIINCHSSATVEVKVGALSTRFNCAIGGIVGYNYAYYGGNAYIIGCTFSGQIKVNENSVGENVGIGGITGRNFRQSASYEAHVVGCLNTGSLLYKNAVETTDSKVGGVVGGNGYDNWVNNAIVTACANLGKVSFENVEKREPLYSSFDGGIGYMGDKTTATHVYWASDCISADWKNPYRAANKVYDTLLEVDGSNITWATAVDNMNVAIETWNAANGNLCPNRYELKNGVPTLVEGMP